MNNVCTCICVHPTIQDYVCVCVRAQVCCARVYGVWEDGGKVCPPCLLAVVLHSTAVAEPGSHKTTLAMKTAHFFTIAGHLCGFC